MIKRLAVYCGSNEGADPSYAETTRALGAEMGRRGIDLVYGGGKFGLMGIIADSVIAAGGKTYGVIPDTLREIELAHPGLTKLYDVRDMHQRKAKMTDLADAFFILPGGIGTLDEMFEAWTWHSLGYHRKPLGVLNMGGYWDEMIAFLDKASEQKFVPQNRRDLLIVEDTVDRLLDELESAIREGRGGPTI